LIAFYEQSYLLRLNAKGVTVGTRKDYDAVLKIAPDFISSESVTKWLGRKGASAATRNRHCRILLAVVRAARRQGLLQGRWIEGLPVAKTTKRIPRAWMADEFDRLLAACDAMDETYFRIPAKLWWHAFLLGMWYTGARVNTLLAARRENFDARGRTIVLESPKDRSEIFYPLPADAVAAILAMRHARNHLWPWPYDDRKKTLLRRMRQLIDTAGLPQLKQPFHAIRRSVASYMAAEVGLTAASEALHHCRPSITREHYIDPRILQPRVNAGDVMPQPGADGALESK